jgi:hypothetical protein
MPEEKPPEAEQQPCEEKLDLQAQAALLRERWGQQRRREVDEAHRRMVKEIGEG